MLWSPLHRLSMGGSPAGMSASTALLVHGSVCVCVRARACVRAACVCVCERERE